MQEILLDTYTIALPIILGYIVWLLKQTNKKRDANTRGTMLLLRVQLIEYHDKYCAMGIIPSYAYQNFCESIQSVGWEWNDFKDEKGSRRIGNKKERI